MDDATGKHDKPTSLASRIGIATGFAALLAGAFYFVGWQYKQSLALAFGLAGYPGDLSFQGTVASGVSVFDSRVTVIGAATLTTIYWLFFLLGKIPGALKAWLDHVRLKRVETIRAVRSMRKQLDAGMEVNEEDLGKHERQANYVNWSIKALKPVVKASRHSFVVGTFVLSVVAGAFLIGLFYAGHYVANLDARDIRKEAQGRCDGCFVYDTKPTAILGVPVFQSADTIYVQEFDGLARVSIGELQGIQAFRRTEKKPLSLPRR